MEIMQEDRPRTERPEPRRADLPAGKIYLGAVLVVAGLAWLLYNVDWIGHRVFRAVFSWQMLLVMIGGYLLVLRQWTAGAIIGCIGLFLAVTDWFGLAFPFGRVMLPVAVIAVGIALMLSRSDRRRR